MSFGGCAAAVGSTGGGAAAAASPAQRAAIGAANRARAEAEYGEASMIAAYRETYAAAMRRETFP